MIIERIDTRVVELPLPRVVMNAAKVPTETLGCVVVRLQAGAQGESFVYTMRNRHTAAVQAMIDSLGVLLIGEDAAYPERLWERLWREIYFFGFGGVSVLAISALDTAVGDAHAKALEQPLGQLLGQNCDAIPAYASQGLWTNSTADELADEAAALKADGWHAMNTGVGRPRIDDDVACVRAVREAIGEDIVLMTDASRAFTVDHAIRLGRRLEEFGLAWIEEPLPAHDHAGIAKVAAALDTPVVIGENDYTRYGFRRILEAGAADMWMLDLARVGGISEMSRVAALASAYDIPVSNHVYAEHSLALLSTPLQLQLRRVHRLVRGDLRRACRAGRGKLAVPMRPGLGDALDWAAIERRASRGAAAGSPPRTARAWRLVVVQAGLSCRCAAPAARESPSGAAPSRSTVMNVYAAARRGGAAPPPPPPRAPAPCRRECSGGYSPPTPTPNRSGRPRPCRGRSHLANRAAGKSGSTQRASRLIVEVVPRRGRARSVSSLSARERTRARRRARSRTEAPPAARRRGDVLAVAQPDADHIRFGVWRSEMWRAAAASNPHAEPADAVVLDPAHQLRTCAAPSPSSAGWRVGGDQRER